MFDLGKVLTAATAPLGLFFLSLAAGWLLLLLKRRKLAWGLMLAATFWLLLWSIPAASIWMRQGLERQFPQRGASDYPAVDAIVVLGGGIQGGKTGWRAGPHLLLGADRAWFGAQLYRAGRAPWVVVSGGNSGWSNSDEPEASAMQAFLTDLSVPASAVLLEAQSRNTEENARYTKQLLTEHHLGRILLVTSALHMPRALALFRAQGIDAIPAPTDFDAVPRQGVLQNWLPDAETLDRSSKAMKEYIAIAINRARQSGN
jgi:uncharacterized SAM-binding protein YcdF (DUF218 family)